MFEIIQSTDRHWQNQAVSGLLCVGWKIAATGQYMDGTLTVYYTHMIKEKGC